MKALSTFAAIVAMLIAGLAAGTPGSATATNGGHRTVLANGYDTPPAPGR